MWVQDGAEKMYWWKDAGELILFQTTAHSNRNVCISEIALQDTKRKIMFNHIIPQ